jgi:hypothetical protein
MMKPFEGLLPPHTSVLPTVAVTAVAAVAGVLIASDLGLRLLVVLLVVSALPLAYFGTRLFTDQRGWLLAAGWLLMLVSTPTQHVTHVPIGYLLELLIFGLTVPIVVNLWRQSCNDKALRTLIAMFLGYLVIALLSTLTGRSQALAAVWQFQYNMKWPLMFGLGGLITWGALPARQWRGIIKFSWVVLLAFVALEIAAPGVHAQAFGPPPDLHPNPMLGFGLRYRGPFTHSGYLAITCALLAAGALAQVVAGNGRSWVLPGLVYLALLLLSGQRQEALALVFTMTLFATIYGWRYRYFLLGLLAVVAVLIGAALIYQQHIPMSGALAQWGLLDSTSTLSERAILSRQGVTVANQYFPLGSGLGTYGGAGAQKFDQSLYLNLGFERYWWFRQGLFLVDTFWPGVIAETGYFGAALLLLLFITLWVTLVRRTLISRHTPLFAPCLTALAALTLMLSNSPSSAALTDPRSCFVFWLLIGAIWQASRHTTTQQETMPIKSKESLNAR